MILAKQLGMIPSWQFNQGWAQNPNFNNNVSYPPGWNQLTTQPVGQNYAPPLEAGLGRASWVNRATARISPDLCCKPGNPCCDDVFGRSGMRGLGAGLASIDPKWLIIGGVGLVSVAVIGACALFLKS